MDQYNNQGYPPPPGQTPPPQQPNYDPGYQQQDNQQGYQQPPYQQPYNPQPNYNTNNQQGYYPPQPKKKNKWLVGCLGCLGVLVVFAIIMGLLGLFVFNKGNKDLDPIIDSYINMVQAQQFEQAYQTLGADWQAVQTKEDYVNFETYVQGTLGTFVNKKMTNTEFSKNTGSPDMATVEYDMEFSNSDAHVIFIFYQYDGVWKIVSVEYNSEIFQ